MKKTRHYSVILRNNSRLENVATIELKTWKVLVMSLFLLVISIFFGGLIVMLTPLREFLPGYMPHSARVAAEEAMLKLDSLQRQTESNQIFLNNLLSTLTESVPVDTVSISERAESFSSDSILMPSEAEKNFVKRMQESEKFNISVLAPLASEGMMFFPVSEESIVTEQTQNQKTAHIYIAGGAPVGSIADGSVIAVYRTGPFNSYDIVIQHPRGFVSRYSQIGTPLVDQGETVAGGQAIGVVPQRGSRGIYLEMWHNGNPLIPHSYLGHLTTESMTRQSGSATE